jgi:hypothetical protein
VLSLSVVGHQGAEGQKPMLSQDLILVPTQSGLILRCMVEFGRARNLTKGESPMELAKLLEHFTRASALTPRRQLRVVGAPMRTL